VEPVARAVGDTGPASAGCRPRCSGRESSGDVADRRADVRRVTEVAAVGRVWRAAGGRGVRPTLTLAVPQSDQELAGLPLRRSDLGLLLQPGHGGF